MRAVVYEGPREVVVKDVPDPQIASPTEMYRSPVSNFVASLLGSCGYRLW